MTGSEKTTNTWILRGIAFRWMKFLCGVAVIYGMAAFFGSGYTPPGICGKVVRHNRQMNIDASPFFYGDVENMLDLIESAEKMHSNSDQLVDKLH